MNNYQVFVNIINFATITISNNKAYINKYKIDNSEIDKWFIDMLVILDFIELDSGNFETNEKHYIINNKYVKIKFTNDDKLIKIINLNKFEKVLKNHILSLYKDVHFEKVKNIYEKFKINNIRKQKLEKLFSINNTIR